MEFIFIVGMLCFIIFLNIVLYIPSLMTVTEEEIITNIRALKKHDWFERLLRNESYKQLITYDRNVRKVIGKCKIKKLRNHYYERKYYEKLVQLLQSQLLKKDK